MRLALQCKTRPGVYLDIYIQSTKVGNRIRCKPLEGQQVPTNLWVECSRTLRSHYPIGTIFKVDVKTIEPEKRKPYLATFHRNALHLAPEFYDYNNLLH